MNGMLDYRFIKKAVSISLLALIICGIFGMVQKAEASGTFRVTAGVHVRSSASSSSNSLTTVNEGSSVAVLEHNPAGWSKVQVGNIVGYIRSDFLKLVIGDTPATFRVTAGVHVRASASTSASSLTTVNQDESVQVLEHDPAGWSKVQVGSVTGYIRSDFLKHAGTATAGSTGSTSGDTAVIGQYKTTGDDVRLRQSGSTSANVIKLLPKGTVVDVLENSANGWSRVTAGGDTGFIRSDLLTLVSADTSAGATQTRYTTGTVNLRAGPSTETRAIRSLARGTAVEVTEAGDTWSKVIHNNTEGYIRNDLLTSSAQGEPQIRYTTDEGVRIRARASTSSSIVKVLARGTEVTVLSEEGNWSNVRQGNTTGYIRSDLLSATRTESGAVNMTMVVTERLGANVRSGPSTGHNRITSLPLGTPVMVLTNESNGWSKVKYNNIEGYIRTDLLGAGSAVELVTMSEIRHLLPYRENIRVVDVRTGISFNIQIYSKGVHADYEPSTQADTDAMFSTRGGVRSWATRPVWVYVGNRVFAAATHGMPHDVDFISGNGVNGHFCLHFHNTTNSNASFARDLNSATQEAYDKRPR